MTKNTAKIKAGIKRLANSPHEIISGTVVAGSVDATACTMTVQTSDDSAPIEGVMLNTITGSSNGLVLIPEDGSNVIIGSIDGPGAWSLLRASNLAKVTLTIANVSCEIDNTQVNIRNGDVLLHLSDSIFKINTASESLFQMLKDCFTYLTELTVSTPAGASSIPVNVADFNHLLTRLNNLLAG